MNWRKTISFFGLIVLLLSALPISGVAAPIEQEDILDKIETLVLQEIDADGQTDFFIWMKEEADLSPAYALETKQEKGEFVFNTLRDTAERTQKDLRAYLDSQGVDYEAYYIANTILVRGRRLGNGL
jgi:hypothetical protein